MAVLLVSCVKVAVSCNDWTGLRRDGFRLSLVCGRFSIYQFYDQEELVKTAGSGNDCCRTDSVGISIRCSILCSKQCLL
jgi:hypothetical protein